MAQIFNAAVMTDAGAALLAASQAGTATLNFTAVVTGNGVYTDKSVDYLRTLTALLSQKQSFDISDVDIAQDVSVQMTSIISNAALHEGYFLNEIGLLCQNGDDATTSTLFSIAVTSADQGDYFPSTEESSGVEITQHFIVKTSNTANITVQIGSDIYALKQDLDAHEDALVGSYNGVHGIRYYSDVLQFYDPVQERWEGIPLGGSRVKVITEDSALYGATVTLTCGAESLSGVMSNAGVCEFTGVSFIGTVSVSAVKGAYSGNDTINIPYFGIYASEVATGEIYTINVTTNEPTLYGRTIIATYGTSTKTATFSDAGRATIKIFGYTGAVTLMATDGTDTASTEVTITAGTTEYTARLSFVMIYGASWDGTSTTAWSRTDEAETFVDPVPYVAGSSAYSSPFDDCLPWSGMVKSTRNGNVVVAIPKFWYKITQNGAGMKVQIADGEVDGFSVSPAHMDRGDGAGERDVVYVGRYHCNSSYKSATGAAPVANITRSAARTSIHNTGSNIWQMDFATRFTLWLLYIVEFADWNSQAKIGYGCGNNSAAQNMGYTDSMPYHTGTTQSSRTSYGLGTQYRNIEGLWDNVYDWCDGCYYDSNGLNIILNPNSFSDSSGGRAVGVPSSGYPSAFSVKDVANTFPMFIPTAASGSDSTYSCDSWDFSASYPCLCVGGNYGQSLNRGLFCVNCNAATYASASRGCRLLELP